MCRGRSQRTEKYTGQGLSRLPFLAAATLAIPAVPYTYLQEQAPMQWQTVKDRPVRINGAPVRGDKGVTSTLAKMPEL